MCTVFVFGVALADIFIYEFKHWLWCLLAFCISIPVDVTLQCPQIERTSYVIKIGESSDERILYLKNGDIVESNQRIAYDALVNDTVVYTCKHNIKEVVYNKTRKDLTPKKKSKQVDDGGGVAIVPVSDGAGGMLTVPVVY